MSEPRTDEKQYWFDQPGNVKLILRGLYVSCAILFVADFFYHRHVDHVMEKLFGFYGIYGFVSCVILVLAAKEMRKVLIRKEDYYEPGESEGHGEPGDHGAPGDPRETTQEGGPRE